MRSLLGQQRRKNVARSSRLSSGPVKCKSSAYWLSTVVRSLAEQAGWIARAISALFIGYRRGPTEKMIVEPRRSRARRAKSHRSAAATWARVSARTWGKRVGRLSSVTILEAEMDNHAKD